jgi:hypothetical protein
MTIVSPLNGGAGLAGKSGRKTANACDISARKTSVDSAAHFMFVAKNTFTEGLAAWGNHIAANSFMCSMFCRIIFQHIRVRCVASQPQTVSGC